MVSDSNRQGRSNGFTVRPSYVTGLPIHTGVVYAPVIGAWQNPATAHPSPSPSHPSQSIAFGSLSLASLSILISKLAAAGLARVSDHIAVLLNGDPGEGICGPCIRSPACVPELSTLRAPRFSVYRDGSRVSPLPTPVFQMQCIRPHAMVPYPARSIDRRRSATEGAMREGPARKRPGTPPIQSPRPGLMIGADCRHRTGDLVLGRHSLCHLS